jgi:hypothetical protein
MCPVPVHERLFHIRVRALLPLQVLVPVPDYTAKCTILVTTGKAKYDATKKAIVSVTRCLSCFCRVLQWMLCSGLPGTSSTLRLVYRRQDQVTAGPALCEP